MPYPVHDQRDQPQDTDNHLAGLQLSDPVCPVKVAVKQM